jgi:hypothetical protein
MYFEAGKAACAYGVTVPPHRHHTEYWAYTMTVIEVGPKTLLRKHREQEAWLRRAES